VFRRGKLIIIIPTTLQQLLGAFSSPRQINDNSIPGSPGIDIGTAPYCHRLLLRLNPLTPNTTCPVAPTNAGTTHQPHYHYHAAPPIPRRFPRQALYPILISPFLLSPARNTYPAIPMPLGPINQIAITTGPCPTHGGYYSPPALHQPANHLQTNSSAYPRALNRGGRRRRTPPTTTTITGNTSTRTQTIKSGQLTLLNPSSRHQNYTTPPSDVCSEQTADSGFVREVLRMFASEAKQRRNTNRDSSRTVLAMNLGTGNTTYKRAGARRAPAMC